MLEFFKKKQRKKFNAQTLKKNDISILILDERWHKLFENMEKTPELAKAEEHLRKLLVKEGALRDEERTNSNLKKKSLEKIIELTTEVFDKNNEQARAQMAKCEETVKQINDRFTTLEDDLLKVFHEVKEANVNLLEIAVNVVYMKMKKEQVRVEELEKLIEDTREALKSYIDEKESLAKNYIDVYTYFHDILGPEELEKLDSEFDKAIPKK